MNKYLAPFLALLPTVKVSLHRGDDISAITRDLTAKVDELDAAREAHFERAVKAEEVAANKVREAVDHRREAARAKRIADKLADLLS